MKIEYKDNCLIVYIKLNEKKDSDIMCYEVVDKIEKYYNIKLKGFYDVNVYNDSNYYILEFIEDNIDVSDYYNKVDLHIKDIPIKYLYCIEDIFNTYTNYYYIYNDKYYIFFDDINIKNLEFGYIIYKDIDKILELGHKVVM